MLKSKKIKNLLSSTIAICALVTGSQTSAIAAVSAQSSLEAKAQVQTSCQITLTSGSMLDFGIIQSPTTAVTANAGFNVSCTAGVNYGVAINNGLNPNGGARQMKYTSGGSNNYLAYSLYKDSAMTTEWGAPTTVTAGTTADAYNVYGKVTAGQNIPAGTYSDTVSIAITTN